MTDANAAGKRTARSASAGRIGARLLAKREILNTNARLLRPLPIGMLRDEIAVRIHSVRTTGVLPIAILAQLRDAHARLRRKLAFRMPLDEVTVSLDRVGALRRAPILLLAAAPRHQHQQTDTDRTISCPDCDHRQHLPLAATGYCTGAPNAERRLDWSDDERHPETTTD
jgi:hypothetical protein